MNAKDWLDGWFKLVKKLDNRKDLIHQIRSKGPK